LESPQKRGCKQKNKNCKEKIVSKIPPLGGIFYVMINKWKIYMTNQ